MKPINNMQYAPSRK